MNTRLEYMYRDASNYKNGHEVIFKGEITDAQIKRFKEHLHNDLWFVPEQVGLRHPRSSSTEDDHCYVEFDGFYITEEDFNEEYSDYDKSYDSRTIGEFVDEFCNTTWDEWFKAKEIADDIIDEMIKADFLCPGIWPSAKEIIVKHISQKIF